MLQFADKNFEPLFFDKGKLQVPLFILQAIEKSAKLPILLPVMSLVFAVKYIEVSIAIFSHRILPPFVLNFALIKVSDCTFIAALVVFTKQFIFQFVEIALVFYGR